MKRIAEIFILIWKIPELKQKFLYTLLFIAIYRLLSFVVIPGIDVDILEEKMQNLTGIAALINAFAGGAFARASIMALGVMPYISASIIMQLMGVALPALQKLQKEGEYGRRVITRWTRLLTIVVCLIQAPGYIHSQIPPEAILNNTTGWFLLSVFSITVGSIVAMWLGEKISDKGLGNGISILIAVGIIADFPTAFGFEFDIRKDAGGMVLFLAELLLLLVIIMFIVMVIQGVRKVPIQFSRRVIGGGEVIGGTRQYLPLKVNSAGVMPIIFAQAIMFLPYTLIGFTGAVEIANILAPLFDIYSFTHNFILIILIILFTYFYTAIIFSPQQISEELKKNGGFIPGIKPGKPTANFIDQLLTKITLPGAILLAIIALIPVFMKGMNITPTFSRFFGGTSILIIVGVLLDTLQQLETNIMMHEYESIVKGEKIKGRIFEFS